MATQAQIDQFIQTYSPYAAQAAQATGLNETLILAQWGNETAYGTEFAEANNIGNIGVYGGGPNPSYGSIQAGVQAYINFMNGSYMAPYKAQWQGQSAAQQAAIIGGSGYAGGGYNDGSGPGSSLVAGMGVITGDGGPAAGAGPGGLTAAEYAALGPLSNNPTATAYLEALNQQNTGGSPATGSSAAANAGSASTTIAGTVYTGTAQQTSALSTIETNLLDYGFTPSQVQQLTNWAWGEITNNVDPSQIAIDLQSQPAFQAAFPFFNQVNQSLEQQGQGAMSVSQYLQLTQSYLQTAQAAGLPAGMLTAQDMATLMEGNVSASELSQRVNSAISYTLSTPAAQQAFNEYFGTSYNSEIGTGAGANTALSLGQMAAIVLNPKVAEPLIQQQLTAAQIGGASVTSGVGALDAATASQLAQAGITTSQATSTFQQIAPYSALETPRPGMGGEAAQGTVSAEQLATGALLGNPASQRQLQTAVEVAKAPFSGGGGFVSNVHGVAGAGSASEVGAGNT